MRSFARHSEEVFGELKGGAVLLLDFDGVLSPIARYANKAVMLVSTKRALALCAQKVPTAVISGRALKDVMARVGLKDLAYVGNHGLEWKIGGRYFRAKVPKERLATLSKIKRSMAKIAGRYKGAQLEDKTYGLTVHYRAVPVRSQSQLISEVEAEIGRLRPGKMIRIDHDNKDFDFRTGTDWNKGNIVKLLYRRLRVKAETLPVYVGDALTDEDAFMALRKGITMRVGQKKGSNAHYFFRARRDVDRFLMRLSKLMK